MAIQAKKAVKHQVKVKIAFIGPSGSGKTFSALRVAKGFGNRT
jgi:ATP-dependent protease Clp ATPase subunit